MANLSRLPTPIIEQWEWQYDGLCRTVDPEVFFPPDSERGPVRQRRELQAKKYCEQCPVLTRCREHALMVQEPYGVWGGLTPRERDRILHEPGLLEPSLLETSRREAGRHPVSSHSLGVAGGDRNRLPAQPDDGRGYDQNTCSTTALARRASRW